MKKLSKEEASTLINKLRDKYEDYAVKYSKAWFNRQLFEERLAHAISNGMDISGFILAEVSNFEKLKEKYESEKTKETFSDRVDKIIEEQFKQIKKYPHRKFHSKADLESSHLYGSLFYLADELYPILWTIVEETELRKIVQSLETKLHQFAAPSINRLAAYTEDYSLLLSREQISELELEKCKNNYLKEAGFLLHELVDFCDVLVRQNEEPMSMPIQFAKSFESAERKRKLVNQFSSLTGFGAAFKIKQFCEDLVADFRLSAFRKVY